LFNLHIFAKRSNTANNVDDVVIIS